MLRSPTGESNGTELRKGLQELQLVSFHPAKSTGIVECQLEIYVFFISPFRRANFVDPIKLAAILTVISVGQADSIFT